MNINKKRLVSFAFLFLVLFVTIMPLVLAQAQKDLLMIYQNAKGEVIILIKDKFGDTATDIIISVIVTLIIFAALYDILELISIFQLKWVKLIITGGLTLIALMYNLTTTITKTAAEIAGGLGAIGIMVEITIAILIFIGLAFGSNYAAKFAAKRRGQVEEIKAIKAAGQTKSAIEGLRTIQEEFRKER